MAEMRPDVVVVERVFFQVNAKTAMSVGQASGLAFRRGDYRPARVCYTSGNCPATLLCVRCTG